MTTRSLISRLRAWSHGKTPVLAFGLKFGALMALFYGFSVLPFWDGIYALVAQANAWLASGVLTALGQDCHSTGATIASPSFAVSVRKGCDAIEPSWYFCAAVASVSAPISQKLSGCVYGTLVITVLNIVRIVSLYFIGRDLPDYVHLVHVEIWPVVFIIAALVLWIYWLRWALPRHESAS